MAFCLAPPFDSVPLVERNNPFVESHKARFIVRMQAGMRAMDIGCGPGGDVVALDIQPRLPG